jgi:hypothetical protein
MKRNEDDARQTPGPEDEADEETQEDAGLPGGGGATTPSENDGED